MASYRPCRRCEDILPSRMPRNSDQRQPDSPPYSLEVPDVAMKAVTIQALSVLFQEKEKRRGSASLLGLACMPPHQQSCLRRCCGCRTGCKVPQPEEIARACEQICACLHLLVGPLSIARARQLPLDACRRVALRDLDERSKL
jgi:hypothetical protein